MGCVEAGRGGAGRPEVPGFSCAAGIAYLSVLAVGISLRIALFPSAFYPSLGGVEELSLRLAQAWQAAGHGVRVYTERWPRGLPAVDSVEGVEVRRFAFRVPHVRGVKPKLTWAVRYRATRSAVIADLNAFGAEIVHIQCVSSAVDYALPAAKALSLPFVVTLQGELSMDASGIYQRSAGAQRRMFRALDQADAITACSGQTLDEAERFYVERGGKPFGERGRVIYNGIDLKSFENIEPHRHDRPYVFALGRHVRQKGFDVLLEAMAQVPKSHDLIMAGDGPERHALETQSIALGLTGRVHFVGRLSASDVRRYMKGAAVFVLPSRHEPFGIVNLEAMASGTPVVATRVGGVPEFVADGVSGVLVEAGDAKVLAEAVCKLIASREQRLLLAEAGRLSSDRFDWKRLSDAYMAAFHAALNGKATLGCISGTEQSIAT